MVCHHTIVQGLAMTQPSKSAKLRAADHQGDLESRPPRPVRPSRMRVLFPPSTVCILACAAALAAVPAPPSSADSLLGFSAASTAKETAIEARFKQIPTAAEARRQHRIFTAEPHPAGSERNNELARYIA